jgi:hypothetical protein
MANAVDHCQAFTPGPANTIRNRVVGAENVGTANMNVACNFSSMTNGAPGGKPPHLLYMYFSNNSASDITISCTLLTGYQGDSNTYAVTKSAAVPAHAVNTGFLSWAAADNPNASATDLGSYLIGINCTLPPGGVINDTYLYQVLENGV